MQIPFSTDLQLFVNQINSIALIIDGEGQIQHCNPYTTRALGWHAYELTNHNFFERLVPADQRAEITQFLAESVERGGLSEFRDMPLYAKNGNVRLVQINSLVALGENAELAEKGFVLVGEDVTNKLRVSNALNKSNAQLQDLIDNTSDLIQLVTIDGKFTFVNRVWRELLGYSSDELPTLRLSDVIWPDSVQATMSQLQRIQEGERVPDFETAFKSKLNKKIYLNGSVTCRYDNGKPTAFRYILHDMTSRVRAERSQNLYYSIANWTITAKDLDELYERIHEELGKVIDVRNFFIALYDPNKSYMYFPYYVDEYFKQNVRFTKRKLGNGLTEYAIRANKPLFLYEEDMVRLAKEEGLYMYGKIPKVMLCVPLRIGERVTGIIGVKSYHNADQYRPRNLELLEFISGQVAVAIARKQNEVELNRQTARLNAIFDSSIYLIWSVSRSFQLTSFNKNYAEFIQEHLRTTPALNVSTERLGWQMMSVENRRQLEERYRLAFRGQPQGFEIRLNLVQKGEMWLEFSLNPILLSSGVIEEVSGVARDITSRKLTELALRQSEEKFRGIFVNLQDIYVRTDRTGIITMISPSVLKRTGYTMEEVLGSNIIKYFVDKQLIHKALVRARRDKSIRNFEADLRVKDGSVRQFMFNMLLLRDNDGAAIMAALARDVTEFKRNELELVKAKDEAERSLKVKERFLANMSHEIRTPMNGVIGMIDLLNETPLNVEQKDYVQTIRRSSETLLNILNDILDLSKIEAGKMALNEAPVSLQEIFDKLTALFSQTAKNKNVHLAYHFDQTLPQFIIADQTRLLQILSNLTSNALKFTENGRVSLNVKNVWVKGKFHKIKVEVRDSGIGITPENLKLLFNAFSQVDTSSRKTFGGTGLGLAISKELCRLMKGEIGVESEWGAGSTFWFTFETKETIISPTQQQNKAQEIHIENFLKQYAPTILLVDDNFVNRKVASEILRKAGCVVDTAESGKRAIELVTQTHDIAKKYYDVILMDIQMPDMDGIETTQRLRAQFGKYLPPIVAMTAYSMKEDRARFLSQGMDEYVPKPIRAQVLIQKIKELMEANKAQENGKIIPQKPLPTPQEMAIPVIDDEVVKQLLGLGGMELVVSIFEEFVIESTELVNGALAAFATGDIATVKSNLHTIKGSAGTIGVARVAEMARIGEAKLKTNDTSTLAHDLPQLDQAFQVFLREYQLYLETMAIN
ncbi:MAG: PAS domain S-box protein [Runella slithyformis]|nr:MAG: PAS domain S-box protein [Runella slithyformis]TAF27454.1 MAG: PAS domain S-box protein [Runella slithyformis]TAF46018.1 MAG: PAS domain S-box protein [Runella slithyformis]TAF81321.1 MAG: PAS domain S-box protein [Runella slithyformis]